MGIYTLDSVAQNGKVVKFFNNRGAKKLLEFAGKF